MKANRQLALALSVALASPIAAPAHAGTCQITPFADLPVTMRGLRAAVPVKVNGHDTEFWLDSGAVFNIMSNARAQEFGLPLTAAPAGLMITGIGGTHGVDVATVKDFGIVGQSIHNVAFLVGGTDSGNALIGRNLLGMADTEFDLAHGSVKLLKAAGCDKAAMAYWAAGKPFFLARMGYADQQRDFRVKVQINGAAIDAMIDSGAPMSLLSQSAARRAGIDLAAPTAVPIAGLGGFGRKLLKGWVVPVASVAVGEEQVLNTHLSVIEGEITGPGGPDMLLGADWLLAHHVYVARGQRQIHFTYTGGKPFLTAAPPTPTPDSGPAPAPAPALPPGTFQVQASDNAAEPRTADEFARRASARLAARQFAPALADYDAALALAPGNALFHRDRAAALFGAGRLLEGRAELDKAITLAPDNPDLRRVRAAMRLATGDEAGALADADAAARAIHPGSLESVVVASLFDELGHADRAIPLFDALIAAHPEDSHLPDFRNSRCWSRALANVQLPAALDDCNRALKGRPGTAAILDSRALVKFRLKDYAGALADYDTAIATQPRQAFSRYMRGLTRIALGQADAGKAERDAALALDKHTARLEKFYKFAP
ncbi:MAG: retroviral-like aspartic protease family protein [Sphingomonadales bacterium]|nr:retroviral-like aspartic protease family protein [Sphingomonadales bacterium]